jgi:hypothetical protein
VDLDNDGDVDLLLTFKTRSTGISCGDTSAILTGETYGGEAFAGIDTFTVLCP